MREFHSGTIREWCGGSTGEYHDDTTRKWHGGTMRECHGGNTIACPGVTMRECLGGTTRVGNIKVWKCLRIHIIPDFKNVLKINTEVEFFCF